MSKKVVTEVDVLEVYVDEMEAHGANKNLIRLNIDEALVNVLRKKLRIEVDLESLRKLADKCLANQWLEHRVLGGKYDQLGLTTTGFGVVRSRQRKQESLTNRTILKKVSDYIEDRKGLFVAIGVAVALAGVLIRLFRGGE